MRVIGGFRKVTRYHPIGTDNVVEGSALSSKERAKCGYSSTLSYRLGDIANGLANRPIRIFTSDPLAVVWSGDRVSVGPR